MVRGAKIEGVNSRSEIFITGQFTPHHGQQDEAPEGCGQEA